MVISFKETHQMCVTYLCGIFGFLGLEVQAQLKFWEYGLQKLTEATVSVP